MIDKSNPFHELYVTESFEANSFVDLFSNVLIDHAAPLFKPGNVILKGLPGTGKTMMLSLLDSTIRLAYKRRNVPFPVPYKLNRYVGAGINLIRSSVADFGQRSPQTISELNELTVYFADFVNFWIVRDILQSIEDLHSELGSEIGINYSSDALDEFALLLKQEDCWFGYLDDVNSYSDLLRKFKSRIVTYRSYLHFNINVLPEDIVNSKTAIGIPILSTVKLLRETQILKSDVQVFIRIDQYEELSWLDDTVEGSGKAFRSVINKLLASRDATVSYRVGTRPFAWDDDEHVIFGTTARLELDRNYLEISIDDVLKRPEDVSTYLFPKFAEDIFRKRLSHFNLPADKANSDLLTRVFGASLSPEERAIRYVPNDRGNVLHFDDSWSDETKQYLTKILKSSPLSARLGEAWIRQKGEESLDHLQDLPIWNDKKKKYWKKERIDQALIQVASRNGQQLIWDGKRDILNLSGGNILAFLNLCQQIWEVWMRDQSSGKISNLPINISPKIQTLGILHASAIWFKKISSVRGGYDRMLFITFIGTMFHKWLTEDKNLSYPGRNGFSLETYSEGKYLEVDKFLKEASDYGDLQARNHTTKSKNKRKRVKWYLNPMLSPYFRIPAIHTKEPYYASIEEVIYWYNYSVKQLENSTYLAPKTSELTSQIKGIQTKLFDE